MWLSAVICVILTLFIHSIGLNFDKNPVAFLSDVSDANCSRHQFLQLLPKLFYFHWCNILVFVWDKPGLFFGYFRPFLILISITISIIQIRKSIDGVLGIWTWGRRMVGSRWNHGAMAASHRQRTCITCVYILFTLNQCSTQWVIVYITSLKD